MYDGPTSQFTTYYRFAQPHSHILLAECTREWARNQVRAGVYPKGSIWIPGCPLGREANPALGDLFAPDERWKGPTPLLAVPDEKLPWQKV